MSENFSTYQVPEANAYNFDEKIAPATEYSDTMPSMPEYSLVFEQLTAIGREIQACRQQKI